MKIETFIRRCFYLKMCFIRTQSYYNFLSSIINLFVTVMIFLKVYSVESHPVGYTIGLLAFIIFHLVFGHFEMKLGLFKIENDLANRHNPQMMDIQRMLKEKERP